MQEAKRHRYWTSRGTYSWEKVDRTQEAFYRSKKRCQLIVLVVPSKVRISVFAQVGFLPLLHRLVEERAGERRNSPHPVPLPAGGERGNEFVSWRKPCQKVRCAAFAKVRLTGGVSTDMDGELWCFFILQPKPTFWRGLPFGMWALFVPQIANNVATAMTARIQAGIRARSDGPAKPALCFLCCLIQLHGSG